MAGPDIREGTHASRPWGVSGPTSYIGLVRLSEGSRLHTSDRQEPRGLTWLDPPADELAGSPPRGVSQRQGNGRGEGRSCTSLGSGTWATWPCV